MKLTQTDYCKYCFGLKVGLVQINSSNDGNSGLEAVYSSDYFTAFIKLTNATGDLSEVINIQYLHIYKFQIFSEIILK